MNTASEVKEAAPDEIRARMARKETFVLNIVTDWCPDCVERQAPHFPAFADRMHRAAIPVFQTTVQKEKLVFLSGEHQELVDTFGGHGYPRTSLVVRGRILDSRVMAMSAEELHELADRFLTLAGEAGGKEMS